MLIPIFVGFIPEAGRPLVHVNILRANKEIYHEAKNFISKRPVRVWSRDSCILDALTLSVVSKSGIAPLDDYGNFLRPSITIPSFANAYFRSAITKLHLNLFYWHLAVPSNDANQPPPWGEIQHKYAATKVFTCFPALREVQVLVYGSKGHRILREAKRENLVNLKGYLHRLVRYIPNSAIITFSDHCPGKTTLQADCLRSLVEEVIGNQLDVSTGMIYAFLPSPHFPHFRTIGGPLNHVPPMYGSCDP